MPNPYVQYVVNSALILAFATIGLNIIFGYAGQHAFGFPVFFGVGAYASALLSIDAALPVGLAIPAGALAAGGISESISASPRSHSPMSSILSHRTGSISLTARWAFHSYRRYICCRIMPRSA
jgi:branched-chain amino acid transport system permease protein